jgi:outer membrane lipoprotein carrier protein
MTQPIFIAAMVIMASVGLTSFANPPTTAPTTQAADPKPASRELLAHLQKTLTTVDTMQANFIQKKHLMMLKHTLTIKGRFAMAKPNKVIWIVDEPTRYAIRVNGEEITQWDQDTNQTQVMHVGNDPTFQAITQQIQAWFLGDYKVLEKSYDVYLLSEQPLSLRFAPQGGTMVSKLVKNIEITFNKDQLQIDKMVVNETTGDSTTLEYSDTKLNDPIPPSTWEIPPK